MIRLQTPSEKEGVCFLTTSLLHFMEKYGMIELENVV